MLHLLSYLALSVPGSDGTPIEIQAPESIPSGGLTPGGGGSSAIQNGVTIFFILIAITALFFFLYGGIKWIMSAGDKSKIDSARKTILYAIGGVILAGLAYFIVDLVGGFFGVDFF